MNNSKVEQTSRRKIKLFYLLCVCAEEKVMKADDTEGQGRGDQTVVMATDGSWCMGGGVREGMMHSRHRMTVNVKQLPQSL